MVFDSPSKESRKGLRMLASFIVLGAQRQPWFSSCANATLKMVVSGKTSESWLLLAIGKFRHKTTIQGENTH